MSALSDTDAEQLLFEVVRTPSVSRNEAAVAATLARAMSALGFVTQIDAVGNVVGEIGSGSMTVALVGHMDTVPGDLPVVVRDGALYGRGAVDAKGPLVAFVVAAARAARPNSGVRVRVVGCVEEEVSSSKGAQHLATTPAPDALVIGEPSGFDGVTLGYKGCLRATVDVVAVNTHSAHETTTAPARAARWWVELEDAARSFAPHGSRAFERLLPALLDVRCDNDGREQRVELDLSLRLPPTLPPAEALRWLRERAASVRCDLTEAVPAWTGPRTTSLHRAFQRAILREGVPVRWKEKTGTSDLNLLAPAWGCPALAYGPGDSQLDHRPDEHLILSEFHAGARVLERALAELRA